MKAVDNSTQFLSFKKHQKRLVSTLKKHPQLDGLMVVCGAHEKSAKSRIRTFTYWYVGQDLQEVIIVVSRKRLMILAELGVAQQLEFMTGIVAQEVTFLKKSTKHNNNDDQIDFMLQHLQRERQTRQLQMAFPIREPQQGVLQEELDRYLRRHSEVCIQDAGALLSMALQIKDKREMCKMKASGLLCGYLIRKMIGWVECAIDQQDQVKHIHLSKRMEGYMKDTSELQIMEHHCQLQGPFGLSSPPIVQSGGRYDFSSDYLQSNHEVLKGDCIVVQLGARYCGYNTACIRTLLINVEPDIRLLYNAILGCFHELVDKLKPASKLKRIYQAVRQLWRANAPKAYLDKFPEVLGWGIGIEQRESLMKIHAEARCVVHVGMCFYIRIAIEGITMAGQKNYAICVGDTVCITDLHENTILTNSVDRSFKKISLQYTTEQQQQENNNGGGFVRLRREQPSQDLAQTQLLQQLKHSQTYFQEIALKHQDYNQESLKLKKQFELEERVFGSQWPDKGTDKQILMHTLESYKSYDPFPSSLQKGRFFIDTQSLTLLVPIRGSHIPFHVTTIKAVTLDSATLLNKQQPKQEKQEKQLFLMRIHFWTSEMSVSSRVYPDLQEGQLFIKEMTFCGDSLERLEDYALLIGELQKQAKLTNARQQIPLPSVDTTQILVLEALILNPPSRPTIIQKLRVRPALSHCKGGEGTLECHLNGFRYVSNKEELIDIPFKAIKHYIYQSPEEEIIAGLHLHLKGPLVISKRRSTDIQFYREVSGALECIENKRKAQLTALDVEFEQGVRRQRQQMLVEFDRFIGEVEHLNPDIRFERPMRQVAFEGNWNRARLFLQPAQSCMVNVVESPFFIVTVADVDIACLERIMVGVKTFDLVFVYKSYEKGWVRVESIDRSYLDQVQQWLNEKNILYFRVTNSLMWKNMLFTITRDFKAFVHEGGWTKIMMEQVDHAPLHNYLDDGSSVFEPPSSEGITSFSEDIPELTHQQLQDDQVKNTIFEEEDISDIANSHDLLGLQESLSDLSE